jgi:hypothetical protein
MKRCDASVHNNLGVGFHQCLQAGKIEHNGKRYCLRHDPKAVAKREADREADREKRRDSQRAEYEAEYEAEKKATAHLALMKSLGPLAVELADLVLAAGEQFLPVECCEWSAIIAKAREIREQIKARAGVL